MSLLDHNAVNRDDKTIVASHDILIGAYDDEVDALALAGQVGLLKADIGRYPKMRLTWWSILEEAAKEGHLRRLVTMALQDPTTANWHSQLQHILGPVHSRSIEKKTSRPSTDGERLAASMRPEVGDHAKLWSLGTTLSIRFLNGSTFLRDAVEAAAMQWVEYANLRFAFDDDRDAPIRVSFEDGGFSWAFVGQDCLSVGPNQPTANFGTITNDTARAEILATVLHEFGHLLGLQHEQGNPASTLKWDRPKVYEKLLRPPNSWQRDMVDRHVFAIWPPGYYAVHKVFDRRSVMIHAMPADYFTDRRAVTPNKSLSPLDKQFAAALYPQRGRGAT